MSDEQQKHWVYRKQSLPILWGIQIVLLVLVLVPEFFMSHYPHFEDQGIAVDASWGFFAWYGFLACAAMVVGAKILGMFLKREDTYYDD